jgi:ribonuclease HI
VTVRADSQLLVRQLEGRYRVKNAGLRPLFTQARALLDRYDDVVLEHVPREENVEADALVNAALDAPAR